MLNWRELPFVRLLIFFIAGILTSFYFSLDHALLFITTLMILWPIWQYKKKQRNFKKRWLFGFLGCLALFLVGFHITYLHDDRNSTQHFQQSILEKDNTVLVEVVDAPIHKGKWVRLKLSVFGIGKADSLIDCSGNLLAYISRTESSEAITYGDLLSLQSDPTAIAPPKNPHSFDFQRYLHFQNIHFQTFVREGQWQVLSKEHGSVLFKNAISLQSYFLSTLRKHLPTEKEFAVGSALILGYRDEIPEEVQTAYSQTGAMHVLAVSGLHVGIVFLIFNFFLKKIKIDSFAWSIAKVLILLAVIWSFALVTGASPSVMRAAVMFSFLNVGLTFKRFSSIYNTLAASAFFMLIYDPYLIASVGFQLSYLAVLGIVYFQPKIAGLWKIKNPLANYLWQLACVSLAAQLMTLPLTFYYFNQLPIYFWLTGLILVPLAGLELGAGIALLLFEVVCPPLAVAFGKVLFGMLWLGNKCVFLIQQLPVAVVEGIWIGGLLVFLLYLLITSSMLAISSGKYKWVVTGLGLGVVISLHFAFKGIERQHTKQMVVYSIYGHTAIDFIDGEKVFSLTDMNMEEKPHRFATQGHRYAIGAKDVNHLHIETEEEKIFDQFYYKTDFAQFYNTKLAIIDRPLPFNNSTKLSIDYILLRNSPKLLVEELSKHFDFKMILLDSSNKKWQVEKWKSECEKLGVQFYDINEQGAFVLDLE